MKSDTMMMPKTNAASSSGIVTLCLRDQRERVDESHDGNRNVHRERCTDTNGFRQRQEGNGYYATQQPVDAPSDANRSTPDERVKGKQYNQFGDVPF